MFGAPGQIIPDPEAAAANPQWKRAVAFANRILWRCKENEAGCWEWQGASCKKGYGRLKIDGQLHSPHRVVAYAAGITKFLSHASPDDNVLHECDNPRCCNPAHLKAGTMSQNMLDAIARGRLKPPPRSSV